MFKSINDIKLYYFVFFNILTTFLKVKCTYFYIVYMCKLMSKKLKYYQQILQKVSFDVQLFSKELKKAYTYLTPRDRDILRNWVDDFIINRADLQLAIYHL